MKCNQCGACCIAISISSPIPGYPKGKPAGVRCRHLDDRNRCRIHGSAEYPDVCRNFSPTEELCGSSLEEALKSLSALEKATL